jgi:hypothetical protein
VSQLRFLENRELAKDAILEQDFIAVWSVAKRIDDWTNRAEPSETIEKLALKTRSNDGKEVQVGIVVESIQFDTN